MGYRILLFIVINFTALAIGGYFTGQGVPSEWYANLAKAPWTPPGWVFGAAWTFIMLCFAVYMAFATKEINTKTLIVAFSVQWVLNVVWNPVFFYFHYVAMGLIVISALTLLIAYFFFKYWKELKLKSLWILPYLVWMIIATSLNAYIYLNN